MPLHKDDSGRRSVQVEVEVPGSPEEVWNAIATGPGVSSWFVPTRTESDEDGHPIKMICNFGPGMDSVSHITEWKPPHTLSAESQDLGEDAPTIATQWIVESKHDGTCIVRVVHSLFSSTDDWDDQLEGWESGWPSFFRILKLYLTHYPGKQGQQLQISCFTKGDVASAWKQLQSALGVTPPSAGDLIASTAGPSLAGTVEQVGSSSQHPEEWLIRLDQPTDGLAHLFAMKMGEQVIVSIRLYLYGDSANTDFDHLNQQWQAWKEAHFPA